ncbi:F-box/LRR-repeat protein 7-like [Schistocerca gregaria]|uniref:F-box/LRR-repeat protein 7-like n=1 Tax=Schistocerca gregaria TaxID=7010 RepID=UPI00211F356A|nr:F-box/LRR-repeat protein 7-like [Schistocerca gregaria]
MEMAARSLGDLPDDALLSIFSLLPVPDLARCAYVCERWRKIVTGYTQLWKGKSYGSNRRPSESAEVRAVLRTLPPLRELVVEVAHEFTVDISYPQLILTVANVRTVRDCPRLTCDYLSTRLDIAVVMLSSRSTVDFSALRKLRILRTAAASAREPAAYGADHAVASALGLCPNLRELSVCAESLSADRLDRLEGLGRLRTLKIECPGLRKLTFLRHCAGALEELQLVGCAGLPPAELAALRRLRRLRRLQLSDCGAAAAGLASALPALAGLESLQLHHCGHPPDLSFAGRCGRLRELCVIHSSAADAVLTLTPEGHRLRLRRGAGVRVVGLSLTADHLPGALPRLAELGLARGCLDRLRFLRHCPQLRHLCCEFRRRPGQPQLLNLAADVASGSST